MRCDECDELLDAHLDGELPIEEARDIDAHLAGCPVCAREHATRLATHQLVSETLVRYTAPDVLKARIRSALASPHSADPAPRATRSWWRLAVAGIAIAAASSLLTLAAARRTATHDVTEELLASHVRSLMPGHLIDIASTDQHQVKPWFNGRVDLSPPVPNLDSAGFPLVGGRADYIAGHQVPVIVYGRRRHIINVYAWPSAGSDPSDEAATRNGYHLVHWRRDGVDYWAVSDLSSPELHAFVELFRPR
jgi:anti-sigma factor RsiW